MNICRPFAWSILVVALLLSGDAIAKEKQKPSGTVVIDEIQVMVILGGDMGHGTLLLGDKSYNFKTGGVKLGGFGGHHLHMVGDVYKLKNVKDFPGLYFAAEAGADFVKGKSGLVMKNDKGVVLHLKASAKGASLNLGAEGFKITMRKDEKDR